MNLRVSTGDSSPERGSPEPQHTWPAKYAAALESRASRTAVSRTALTLLEMMVSVTLLAAIMIGLLAMFNQAQKALHIAHMQADVFENARGAMQIVGRDLMEMTGTTDTNVTYARSIIVTNWTLTLPTGSTQDLTSVESFWLTRVNDDWTGVGYYVADANYGVGTLYRSSGTVREARIGDLYGEFTAPVPTNSHRVSDGIVHFLLRPTYVKDFNTNTGTIFYSNDITHQFQSNNLPAFVDVEIGVLESATLKQFEALKNVDVVAAQDFLAKHNGRIHFFRERVPIRNFVNPYRANEVP